MPLAPYILGPSSRLHHTLSSTLSSLSAPLPNYESLSVPSSSSETRSTSPQTNEPSSSSSKRPHGGKYHALPLTACPICYQRAIQTDKLAPIPQMPFIPALPHTEHLDIRPVVEEHQEEVEEEENEETAIYIPVQADCWGECTYCYYCLGDALTKAQQTARQLDKERRGMGWECWRCGGEVFGCRMATARPVKNPTGR